MFSIIIHIKRSESFNSRSKPLAHYCIEDSSHLWQKWWCLAHNPKMAHRPVPRGSWAICHNHSFLSNTSLTSMGLLSHQDSYLLLILLYWFPSLCFLSFILGICWDINEWLKGSKLKKSVLNRESPFKHFIATIVSQYPENGHLNHLYETGKQRLYT